MPILILRSPFLNENPTHLNAWIPLNSTQTIEIRSSRPLNEPSSTWREARGERCCFPSRKRKEILICTSSALLKTRNLVDFKVSQLIRRGNPNLTDQKMCGLGTMRAQTHGGQVDLDGCEFFGDGNQCEVTSQQDRSTGEKMPKLKR